MGESRNIIVEVRHTTTVAENALEAMTVGLDREVALASRAAPKLEGLDYDGSFAPVALPGRVAREARGPLDLGPDYSVAAALTESTFLVRGAVDEDDMETVLAAADSSRSVLQVYADVSIEPQQRICPGDPPRGDHNDVARLLC